MADLRGSERDLVPAAAEIVPPRYRHPGDVVLLIGSAVWLLVALGVALIAEAELLGHRAAVVPGTEPGSTVGRVLVGLVQVIAVLAPVVVVAALLVVRRFRLLASLIVAAVAAGAAWTALSRLAGTDRPADLLANRATGSLISTAAWPGVAWFAGAVAVTLVGGSWLSLSWRRVVWLVLAVAAVSELIAGVALPMELVLAFAVGSLVGAGVLVVFGAPDHRIGERGIAEALAAAGIPVRTVRPAEAAGKGSRPFVATLRDGQRRFVKVLGRDERHADLLYRGYRLAWLRGVGDTRPAASLKQAVEHQALVGMTAERAGVRVPHVHRIAVAADGSAMLIMDLVTGQAFERAAADDVTDELLRQVWQEVERLHSAGIAHRSLRTANLMVGESRLPWIVDFSFSELVATERQMALDRAELLASLAVVVGPDRAATTAAAVMGDGHLASAVPLLQPLALSHATRRAVGGQGDLLSRTRAAAAAASSAPPSALPRLQRVRPRTLLMIAAAAGAFYFVLPQLAQVSGSWRAFQSADWAWVPLILVMSFLTYVASGISLLGTLAQRLPFGPTLLTQWASSFVNRVSPANVGGMALNARFLQKCGVDPGSSVAAIGLNAVAGGIVHAVLLVVFFAWSSTALTGAFKLPSSSKLLLALAVLVAVVGAVIATRWGRRVVLSRVVSGVRSALGNLRQVARSPLKLTLLFGGSTALTLAYIAAFAAAVQAFGDGISFAKIGTVYLAGSLIAAAAPTPGGLGPLEAALIAGLTGFGMPSGPAVSAVLTYRLATYWLPVLPGWLSLRLLQGWDYV